MSDSAVNTGHGSILKLAYFITPDLGMILPMMVVTWLLLACSQTSANFKANARPER